MTPLLMALAGGVGAGTRFALGVRLPRSTLLVNISGSLLLGLLVGSGPGDAWLTIAGTGFLGGYTTFSTASVETVQLALDGRHRAAALTAATMLVLGIAAASCGYALGHTLR